MINHDRLVNNLLDLLRIGSHSKQEEKLAARVERELRELGLEPGFDQAGPAIGGEAGNLVALLPGSGPGPELLLCAHLDTVPPGEGVSPRIEDGVIRGDGGTILGADDKAGIAAALEALRVIRENALPHPQLAVIFTVAEEIGLLGAKHLDPPPARAGFVLDATGPVGTIVHQAPSQEWVRAEVTGKAAHAGIAPEQGINAIQIASRAIASLPLGRLDSETTANIGIIQGGRATNVVPDRVRVEGEVRSHRLEKLVFCRQQMLEAFHQAAAEAGGGVEMEVEPAYQGYSLDAASLPVTLARRAARQIGLSPTLEGTGGGSDANVFNAKGIPTVVLGVGYSGTHSLQEEMPVDELVRLADLVLAIVRTALDS